MWVPKIWKYLSGNLCDKSLVKLLHRSLYESFIEILIPPSKLHVVYGIRNGISTLTVLLIFCMSFIKNSWFEISLKPHVLKLWLAEISLKLLGGWEGGMDWLLCGWRGGGVISGPQFVDVSSNRNKFWSCQLPGIRCRKHGHTQMLCT